MPCDNVTQSAATTVQPLQSDSKAALVRLHPYRQHAYPNQVPLAAATDPMAPSLKLKAAPSPATTPNITSGIDNLVVEAAIAIVINGIHYAVLMASPYHLEHLAVGFLFSEGLIAQRQDVLDCDVTILNGLNGRNGRNGLTDLQEVIGRLMPNGKGVAARNNASNKTNNKTNNNSDSNNASDTTSDSDNDTTSQAQENRHGANPLATTGEQLARQLQDYDAYVVEVVLNQRCHQRIQAQKRLLAGRTGCGMCGITGLTQALPDLSSYRQPPQPLPSLAALLALRAQVLQLQDTHQLTGGAHAAATMVAGQLQVFEDVGRHNALDKLIGWQLRYPQPQSLPLGSQPLRHLAPLDRPDGLDRPNGVMMTSRLSIELVQKAIRMRLPWLVGMSAPTSTAVRIAARYGLGLGGFLRDNRVTFYTPTSDISDKP